MLDEYDKCRFCKKYNYYDGCAGIFCTPDKKEYFEPNRERIIKKAKEKGISIVDLIALINMEKEVK